MPAITVPSKRRNTGFTLIPSRDRYLDSDTWWTRTLPALPFRLIRPRRWQSRRFAKNGFGFDDFELQSSDATKRKAGKDYSLGCVQAQARATRRQRWRCAFTGCKVDIAGDQVVGFTRSFKLPEDWVRKQESTTLSKYSDEAYSRLTFLHSGWRPGLLIFVHLVRAGKMPWGQSAKFGVLLAILKLLGN